MTLALIPRAVRVDANGAPRVGAKTFFFDATTTTPRPSYTTPAFNVAHPHGIPADSNGVFPAAWFSDADGTGAYKRVVRAADDDGSGTPLESDDNLPFAPFDQSSIGLALYPRTAAEIAAAVTPVNYAYAPGDYRRYGADPTGVSDCAAAINACHACNGGGTGRAVHSGGTFKITSSIVVPNGITIEGYDRTACIFSYVGTGSAFKNVNGPNSSGYGRVIFRNIQITTATSSNTGAAIELNSGGFAFYEVDSCRLTGTFLYGLILDGTEVAHFHDNIIENGNGIANSANIWIVNGGDRVLAQTAGFTNRITINDNQINGGFYGIADDGGSNHYIMLNNLNGNSIPVRMAGVLGFTIYGNEVENAAVFTGTANIFFTTTGLAAVSVGACQGGSVEENFLGANMAAGASTIVFGGTAFHQGIKVRGNWLRNNTGRISDIDVTKLANSSCKENYVDSSIAGGAHYTGTHNDANGNELGAPQNGFGGGFSEAAHVRGDTRYPYEYYGGIDAKSGAGRIGLNIDAQKWQQFTIEFTNTAGTIQHAIFDNTLQGSTSAYVDKVTGASTTLANTPSVAAGTGFTSGAGLINGATSHFTLNTAAQVLAKANLQANITYYDGNATRCRVYGGLVSRNINGTTLVRPEFALINDMTGAAVNIDTTLLPAGKQLWIQISGFIV